MTYLSICSGIEAASVAWKPLGFTPLGFSEIEKFPCAVLQAHYPDDSSFEAKKLKKLESITWEQYATEQIADAQHKVDYSWEKLEEEKHRKAEHQEFLDRFLKEIESVER